MGTPWSTPPKAHSPPSLPRGIHPTEFRAYSFHATSKDTL